MRIVRNRTGAFTNSLMSPSAFFFIFFVVAPLLDRPSATFYFLPGTSLPLKSNSRIQVIHLAYLPRWVTILERLYLSPKWNALHTTSAAPSWGTLAHPYIPIWLHCTPFFMATRPLPDSYIAGCRFQSKTCSSVAPYTSKLALTPRVPRSASSE